jgi:ribosome-associated toxin RatA of RatAB toxin-antitoxin module
MWSIEGDEFKYEETVVIDAPLPVVYGIVSNVDHYDEFLTDVTTADMEGPEICHMVVRAGPLRVGVRTRVTYKENERVDFVMVEGPPVQHLGGSWEVRPRLDGGTDVRFKGNIKAGRAGAWLLKTASRYVERKAMSLIDAFREQIVKAQATPAG